MLHISAAVVLLAARLVLNELMVKPGTGGSEWVELHNAGDGEASLAGLSLEDARGRPARLPDGASALPPGAYVLLAASPEKVLAAYPEIDPERVFALEGSWPTLNDSDGSSGYADILVLRSPAGPAVDSLIYQARWLGPAGVSLERVDPGTSALLAANWSPSLDARGATPLGRNSVAFSPEEEDQGALIVPSSPATISGSIGAVTIGWRVARPGQLAIELFDLAGRSVRLLKPLETCGPAGRVVWDGRDDGGAPAATGVYLVLLEGRLDGESLVQRWRRPLVLVRGTQ